MKISVADAEEVRRFSDFLCEMSDTGIRPGKPRTPEEQAKVRAIYLKHYPEYATPKEDQP